MKTSDSRLTKRLKKGSITFLDHTKKIKTRKTSIISFRNTDMSSKIKIKDKLIFNESEG